MYIYKSKDNRIYNLTNFQMFRIEKDIFEDGEYYLLTVRYGIGIYKSESNGAIDNDALHLEYFPSKSEAKYYKNFIERKIFEAVRHNKNNIAIDYNEILLSMNEAKRNLPEGYSLPDMVWKEFTENPEYSSDEDLNV